MAAPISPTARAEEHGHPPRPLPAVLSPTDALALEQQLRARVRRIRPLDGQAMQAAQARQTQLTKPAGALGRLESLAVQLAGICGQAVPRLTRKVILVAAGDHGVCAAGVSPYPQTVTGQMVANFLAGGAAVNVLAQAAGARVTVLDLGVAHPLPWTTTPAQPQARLVSYPLGPGTANFTQGPAMTRGQTLAAMLAGAATVDEEIARGMDVLGLGEMGIGNTTAAAALTCAITGARPQQATGPGAGLNPAGIAHKAAVVARALEINGLAGRAVARPFGGQDPEAAGAAFDQAVRVSAAVGGFEIAGLVGATVAAAGHGAPVVVDGYIATAAAAVAVALAPGVRPYLVPAHRSAEPGHALLLEWLGLEPYLSLDMRLGEGTGAALAMHLIDAAWQTLAHMATFGDAGVDGKEENNRAADIHDTAKHDTAKHDTAKHDTAKHKEEG